MSAGGMMEEEIREGSSSEEEEEDDEGDFEDYYVDSLEGLPRSREEEEEEDRVNANPEYFPYEVLTPLEAESFLNESASVVARILIVSFYKAKHLLHNNEWNASDVYRHYVPPERRKIPLSPSASTPRICEVCTDKSSGIFSRLPHCNHSFCDNCWALHFETQIILGLSTGLSCMDCDNLATEDFILSHLKCSPREKFKKHSFQDYVRSHPLLRFCPGLNCKYLIKAKVPLAKRIICTHCKTSFCFMCGLDYHAPTDCETIKRWLTKCADDSETANYISAHTKDCPKCNICIEKNGGCNHMQCVNCKHDFCWMCLGDWRTHGSEYYECSRYKENPNIALESAHAQAREALKKYLHYFERWENHSKSLKLEAQTFEKIKNRIQEKVMCNCGTWIDWQYLLDAADLLAKCRYTLQYTYPYAYYMEPCPRKELFEYQQAQLEAEIENLSWKIEHAETTDRGDLENQIDIAEKRRTSLLKDFLVA
ncbi:potential E3 ubiquitin-protein ligase ariadne-2 [Lepeophtheirus salmonis]|uniref:potential E3 ubiquitin-protein ligase ariadne-2 n=1 Tax=Lepeophtheirus salmonis TaxID=72036 RepID=UPI001AE7CB41|nr:potential E3 ubiquitin-protein ligase ariadne-2-like [Lepeophtheirus salmonis]